MSHEDDLSYEDYTKFYLGSTLNLGDEPHLVTIRGAVAHCHTCEQSWTANAATKGCRKDHNNR